MGLSTVLLDIYTEKLLPPPPIPQLDASGPVPEFTLKAAAPDVSQGDTLPFTPLGLSPSKPSESHTEGSEDSDAEEESQGGGGGTDLLPPHKATSLPLVDRLAARDRAYGLLAGLTRLGSGWDYSEAWFAIARAYEESGEAERAKEALWWCVELEEGMGVRGWGGRYIIV